VFKLACPGQAEGVGEIAGLAEVGDEPGGGVKGGVAVTGWWAFQDGDRRRDGIGKDWRQNRKLAHSDRNLRMPTRR
jgi:hypothetical protein